MKEDFEISLRLSAQRALLGEIASNMRLITIGWDDELRQFQIIVYFDKEVTEDDKENINNITAEILADIDFKSEKIECVYEKRQQNELKLLSFVVFARKEK